MSLSEIINELKLNNVTLQLQGEQLKLVGKTANLSKEFITEIRKRKDGLISFLKETSNSLRYESIQIAPKASHYTLTGAQKQIWIASQFEGGNAAYTLVNSFYLKGIEAQRLQCAFGLLIQRHESLRTIFKEVEGEPRQFILDKIPFTIDQTDFKNEKDTARKIAEEESRLQHNSFSLEHGPLFKVKLIELSTTEHALLLCMHHIISDGWSVGILMQELITAYTAADKLAFTYSPLSIQYKDYANWLEEKQTTDSYAKESSYWKERLNNLPEAISIASDFVRPETKKQEGAISRFYLKKEQYREMQVLCKNLSINLFNFLHTAIGILLYKYTGQRRAVIGTPVSGRQHAELENQLGMYVNTLALLTEINPEKSVIECLRETAIVTAKDFQHQAFPFDQLMDTLTIRREAGRNPLFDVMLVLQNTAIAEKSIRIAKENNIEISFLDKHFYKNKSFVKLNRAAKFDLTFDFLVEEKDALRVEIEYSTELFTRERIYRLGNMLTHILSQMLKHPKKKINQLELLNASEKRKLLYQFNEPIAEINHWQLADLLKPSFRKHKEKTALICGKNEFSYKTIDEHSDQLAYFLTSKLPMTGNSLVAIFMERTEWTLISILGILKAGATYVPIDPTYPAARIEFMLEDADPEFIITDKKVKKNIPLNFRKRIIDINAEKDTILSFPKQRIYPRDLREKTGYLIYTSGSTGKPKGVEICHRNVIAFLQWAMEEFRNTPFDLLYATTSYCFDLSIFEFLFPLLTGKTIRLLNSAMEIVHFLPGDQRVMLNTVPSVVRNLLEEKIDLSPVSALNMAGEAVPKKFKQALPYSSIEVRNLYGPSEDTTYSTCYLFEDDGYDDIPIGKPISNTQLYILDEYLHLLPEGVDGEIYLSGQGIAKGYHELPELTKEKFLTNPFLKGQLLYKTGDVGRWLPDGQVQFTGRIDDQVKVRGYRIELGEIQYQLEQIAGIEQAVVVVKEIQGDKHIIAYWKGINSTSAEELKGVLVSQLPAYSLPSFFIQLETIPLNANGKVDKKALPLPDGSTLAMANTPPENELEVCLHALWKQVLPTGSFGVTTNFFELGGHSLNATRLKMLIHKELKKDISLQQLFQHSTIQQQAKLLDLQEESVAFTIERVTPSRSYPLSSTQQRLWVIAQLPEGNKAYNMPGIYKMEGKLDVDAMAYAFNKLIERHEILRTVFKEDENAEVRQFILTPDEISFKLKYSDLQQEMDQEQLIKTQVAKDMDTCFDLSNGPLMRAGIYQLEDRRWIFTYVMHHIISDGWSMGIIISEVLELYNAQVEKRDPSLHSLKIQFKDYTAWAQQQLTTEQFVKHKQYWLQQFEGEIPVLNLPTDKKRPAFKTYNGTSHKGRLNDQLAKKLKEFCQQKGGTVFMGLVAAVNAILYRYTNQEDLIIGVPVAGRDQQQLEHQIGCYINTLALRATVRGGASFNELFENSKQLTLQAYEHQAYPFDELVNALPLQRDLSRNVLFDVMVSLQDASMNDNRLNDLQALQVSRYEDVQVINSKVDLFFDFIQEGESIRLNAEYNTDIFSEVFIHSFIHNFLRITELLLDRSTTPIGQLDFLEEKEKQVLINDFNTNTDDYAKDKNIIDLFEEQVVRTPDEVALVFGDSRLTYKELNDRSNQLGDYLRKIYKVKPDDLIGIKLERTEWMIIAILGVLKSGAAYVPIDPTYPGDRIDYMISDSQCCLLIDKEELEKFKQQQYTYGKTNRKSVAKISNLAYVIYTSGSTGQPKGVMIEHGNVLAFIHWCIKEFANSDFKTVFAVTSICFDLSIFEMFYPLCIGKKIQLLSSALDISEHLTRQENILLNTVPSVVGALLSEGADLHSVKVLNLAGEPIPARYISALSKEEMEIRNLYGPTEDTTYSSVYTITDDANILIGRPIANTQFYILNDHLVLQPLGVVGEIHISGDGLARGYLGKLELTNEKFITNPFNPEQKLYKTGDLGRWLPDGNIELLGRKDEQVKIRGFRIELGEIENVLRKYASVKEAVVVAKSSDEGSRELIAYMVTNEQVDVTALRNYMNNWLPAFMIPSFFVSLEQMPHTPNGKIDKKRLPVPEGLFVSAPAEYIAPRNETERILVSIWKEVLGIDKIGIKDNFFELGGHSLKATRVISRINQRFGTKMEFKSFFNLPILADQACLLAGESFNSYNEILPVTGKDRFPLSYAQRRLSLLCQFPENNVAYNMIAAFSLTGELNRTALEYSFKRLTERHEILRTVFKETETGEMMQWIIPPGNFRSFITYIDFRNEENKDDRVHSFIEDEAARPFDLAEAPLISAYLIQTENDNYFFVYNMHHIISDGWSMNVLINEVVMNYQDYLDGRENNAAVLKIQYKDYSNWLEKQIEEGKLDAQRDYWMNQLKGELHPLELPGGDDPMQQVNFNGKRLCFTIPPETRNKIKQLVSELLTTEFTFHLAAFESFLFLYTQQKDIILGIPVSARAHLDLEDQIGFYVNLLPLRMVFDNEMTFQEAIHKMKEVVSMALTNQMYPLDLLMPKLQFKRKMGNSGFINAGFTWQDEDTGKIQFHEKLSIRNLPIPTKTVKHDLWLIGNGMDFSIEYRKNVFSKVGIQAFVESYVLFLEQVTGNNTIPMSQYNLLTETEIEKQKNQLDITINF